MQKKDAHSLQENLQWVKRLNEEKVEAVYLKHFGSKYREYRELWRKAGEDLLPEFPINLDIEVVDACNLHCLHCFRNREISEKMGLTMNTGTRFSLESFKRNMAEGAKYGLKAVNFGFSGECLLNPNLIDMIYMAREAGVLDIRLITNGTLMTQEMIDNLLVSPLTFLSFSIDAGKADTYARMKGRDCFKHLHQTVKYAYRKRIEMKKALPLIRASFYPSPESSGEEDLFLDKFKDHVDFIDFQEFKDIRKVKRHRMRTDCRMPFRRLAIFADGDVAPCCAFFSKKLIVGSIKRMSLKEIWDSKAMQEIRDGLIKERPVHICAECLLTIG